MKLTQNNILSNQTNNYGIIYNQTDISLPDLNSKFTINLNPSISNLKNYENINGMRIIS